MEKEHLEYHARWKASSGHRGGWRVTRQFFLPLKPPQGEHTFQEAVGPKGKLRLFKTQAAATKAANKLNAKLETRA